MSLLSWSHFEKFESYIPIDLFVPRFAVIAFCLILAVILLRYVLLVIPFMGIFYSRHGQEKFERFRIYETLPPWSQQKSEIMLALQSSVIFALAGLMLGWMWQSGVTKIFLLRAQYGELYFWIGAPLALLFLHETYFYWTHRLLHLPLFFRMVHVAHHRYRNPSPWASFAFHPAESFVNAGALPIIVLILPLHPLHILFHLGLMTLSAISNHSGYEFFPPTRWFISGEHHRRHHHFVRANFGLFFSFWDRLMQTEKSD